MDRKVSIPFFGLTLVFYFLNWVIVQVFSFASWSSGFGILKGNQYAPGDPFAVIPLIASLAGIGLVFVNSRRGIIGATAAGVIGALSLIWIRIATSMQISSLQHAKPDNSANFDFGASLAADLSKGMVFKFTFVFYLTILLFVVAAGINLYYLMTQPKESLINKSMQQTGSDIFCTECGLRNQGSVKFCTGCGSKLT
jgi:hypothetical protein